MVIPIFLKKPGSAHVIQTLPQGLKGACAFAKLFINKNKFRLSTRISSLITIITWSYKYLIIIWAKQKRDKQTTMNFLRIVNKFVNERQTRLCVSDLGVWVLGGISSYPQFAQARFRTPSTTFEMFKYLFLINNFVL